MQKIIAVALAMSLAGCGRSYDWKGTFQGIINPETPLENEVDGSLRRVELTVNADGTATLIYQGFPFEGELATSQKTARFAAKKVLGKAMDLQPKMIQNAVHTVELEVVDPNQIKITLRDPGKGTTVSAVLNRKSQPNVQPKA